ncbi:MAG: TIM44-like domain-containing protein, partial [Deltaproteobacteria bacterium]|nr:TIM44-like domain-containing protein [Deltaproteobacteria bacterium]
DMIRKSFVQLQEAWSNQDVHLLQTLLYPTLFTDWFKQIDDMIAKGERNQVRNVIIRDLAIVDVQNYQNNDQDCFTVCVDASASDLTFNSVGEIVKDQTGAFREFWTYQWCDGAWRLIAVSQKDKWQLFVNAPIVDEGPSSGFKKAG